MGLSPLHECFIAANYYAPRGAERLIRLGNQLSIRYLWPNDRLIGIIGEPGTGKSLLIRGMFPGMELTNDDEGVNVRPLPLSEMEEESYFNAHTYHVDIRFESGFTQPHALADMIRAALDKNKRVVVEHFDLIYPILGMNAELLVGMGEEIIITRPGVMGPFPDDMYESVKGNAVYRKMAHTAEDITCFILARDFGYSHPGSHSDFPRGFVIEFDNKPEFSIQDVQARVNELIERRVDISYVDEQTLRVGSDLYPCTGPRIHVENSSGVEDFRLLKRFYHDPFSGKYMLIGRVGKELPESYTYKLQFDERHFEK